MDRPAFSSRPPSDSPAPKLLLPLFPKLSNSQVGRGSHHNGFPAKCYGVGARRHALEAGSVDVSTVPPAKLKVSFGSIPASI